MDVQCSKMNEKPNISNYKPEAANGLRLHAPYSDNTTIKFSTADVDNPTHATIVNGFHMYTRAAISPEGRASGNNIEDIKRGNKILH